MVFNMAAVGCSSIERKEMGEKSATKLALACKRNGLNHGCYCEEKMETRNNCRSQILDKLFKINGSVKTNNNIFSRPSIPSLRSRRERHPSEPEAAKRRRRSSRHDPGDARAGEPPDGGQLTPVTPDTPDSLEVASINQNCINHTNNICNRVPHTKEIKELLPLVSGTNGLVPVVPVVTPDSSRSCTPISLGASLGPSPSCSPFGSPINTSSCSKGDSSPAFPAFPAFPAPTNDTNEPSTALIIKCQWKDCDITMECDNIMEHIRTCHVQPQKKNETRVCLWAGCKVYDKKSSSKSFLDRHILTHSGDKPWRCIVDGCGARFPSQGGLERHVNSHFNAQEQSPNQKHSKHGREDTPTKLFKRKRLKQKRGIMKVKIDDYVDSGIMDGLQQQLNDISHSSQLDLNGSTNSVTFHSSVMARRTEESGKQQYLLHWTPENILPDEWVPESQVEYLHTCSIPIQRLPRETAASLHPALYLQHRYRKHRRK